MILSASRRTDIPKYYMPWFMNRLKEGYFMVPNPMNKKQVSRIDVSPDNVECIVFWSKEPGPLLEYLDQLDSMGYIYYIQYTLNGYPKNIEKGLPDMESRIETFQKLSDWCGSNRVLWRYDPIFVTDTLGVDFHIDQFKNIGKHLSGNTERVTISEYDDYRKVRKAMSNISHRSLLSSEVDKLYGELSNLAKTYGMSINSCAEERDLRRYGIESGKCIDDVLISKIIGEKLVIPKHNGQRKLCGCVRSEEIGMYHSCHNGCIYCYATDPKFISTRHDPNSDLLIGALKGDEKVTVRKTVNYRTGEMRF